MPKYFLDKIAGYYLYYTKHCVIECMHAHASDRKLTEGGSAKFLFWKMVPQLYKTEAFSMIEKFSRFKSSLNCTIWKCMRSGQRTVKKDFMVKTNKCHRHKGVLLYVA